MSLLVIHWQVDVFFKKREVLYSVNHFQFYMYYYIYEFLLYTDIEVFNELFY